MWTYNYTPVVNELYHYGVLGMKWGVHKAIKKLNKIGSLEKKAFKKDIKSEKATKRSEKLHARWDLGVKNRAAKKASKFAIKSSKIQKKALKLEEGSIDRLNLERRAAKYNLKSAKKRLKANRLSKTVGYGRLAMRWSVKADKRAIRAAKIRKKIANNKRYAKMMQMRINEIPKEKRDNGYEFTKRLLEYDIR